MTTTTRPNTLSTIDTATLRSSAILVASACLAAAVAYLVLTIGFQLGLVDIGTEAMPVLVANRDLNWIWYGLTGLTVVVLAATLSATTWFLVPRRGSVWAAVGGAMAVIGSACVAVGEGSQAAILYFGTLPELGETGRRVILDAVNSDLAHTLGLLLPGNILWHLSFAAFGIGLLRSAAAPRWIAIVLFASVVLSFLPAGLPAAVAVVGELVHATGPVALAVLLIARSVGTPAVRSARG